MTSAITLTRLTPSSPSSLISRTTDFALGAWRQLFAPRMAPEKASTTPPDLASFASFYLHDETNHDVTRGTFIVAHTGSASDADISVVGIIAFRPLIRRFTSADLQFEGKEMIEVVRLYVDPNLRGQGLAGKLIKALIERAEEQGVEGMYLHTQPFLPGAAELWRKKGWTFIEQDQDGVWDSIHMVKWLK